jgi:hypothetical protein
MDEILVTQIGLLLNQFRYTRRALEDIERSTARYGGVTFALALSEGPRFGAPPLAGGALKVFVTNINDLTVGRGAAGLFEGLLGGIGRFIGGLGGGFLGGIIGGVSLWVWVGKLKDIVQGIDHILDRMGIIGNSATAQDKDKEKTDWPATLERMNKIIQPLTALFDAAARGSQAAGKTAAEQMPEQALDWTKQLKETLQVAGPVLDALDKVVLGLTFFVPILIGALAWLLVHLDPIKLAILDLLQFALRITLLLRGAALVTIYDTISAVAKLGADILDILKTAVTTILSSIVSMIGTLLETVEEFIKFAGAGLKNAMDALLDWLVNGLGRVLEYLANLRIFRLLAHLVEILPSILPALITLKTGEPSKLSAADRTWLEGVKDRRLPGPEGATIKPGKLPEEVKFPDFGAEALVKAADFKKKLQEAKGFFVRPEPDAALKKGPALKSEEPFNAAITAFRNIDSRMQEALTKGETGFEDELSGRLTDLKKHADKNAEALANAMAPSEKETKDITTIAGDKNVAAIATGYENWLQSHGLETVVAQLTSYFKEARADQPSSSAAAIPAAVVDLARPEAPKATVEIGELIIDIEPVKTHTEAKTRPGNLLEPRTMRHPAGYNEPRERGDVKPQP